MFFHCLKQDLNTSILIPFSASTVFLFYLFHTHKMFPFEDFFHQGNEKKNRLGRRDQVNREGGVQGSCCFCSKTVEHSAWCGQVCSWVTHHEMGKHIERMLKKKFTEAERSLSQHPSGYTDIDGFLQHSPNGGSLYYKGPALQKIIPFFGGVPPCILPVWGLSSHFLKVFWRAKF